MATNNSSNDKPSTYPSCLPTDKELQLIPAVALYDYHPRADESNKLALQAGETIYILKQHRSGWWSGLAFVPGNRRPRCGWFPASYVKLQQNPSPPAADSQQLQEQPQQQQIAQAPTASAERRFSIKLQQSTASFERSSSPERPSEAVVEQPRQTAPHQTQFSRSNSRDLVPEMKSTVTRGVSMPNLQAAEKSSIAGAVSLVNPLERDVSLSLSASKLNTRMPDSLPNIVPPAPTAAPRSQSTQRMAGGGASVNSLRPSPSTNSISQSNVSISTASTKSDSEEIDEDSTVNNLNESLKKVKTLVEQEQKEMEQAAEHGLPKNWRRKIAQNGKEYFCNIDTNETVWRIEDIGSINTSNNKSPISPSVAYKNFKDDRQLNRLKSAPKWDAMISKIAEEISALSLAAKEGRKARYPAMSRAVLQSIKEMLGACGAVDRESQLLSQNIPLRDAHSDIMNSLSRFVGFANAARKVWPPPDAATEMRFELERINLALRKFVDLAIDANVDLKEIATGPPEKKAVAAPPVFIEDNVTHVPPPLPLPLPRQNSQMNLPAVGSGSELIGKLEEVFQSIKKAVKTLLDLKNNSGTIEQIIFYAKKVLADGGCFATLFDEFSVEEALGVVKSKVEAQRLLKENQMLRSTLLNNLSGLQLSSEQFSDPFAPSNVVSQVVAQAGVVLKNAWNLLLSTKTILDAAESVEQTQDMKTSKSLIIDTVHARRSSLVGENKPKSPFESSSRRGSMGPVPLPTRSSTDNSPSNTSAQPIKSSLGVASETALSDTSETNVYRSSLLPGQKLMKFFGEDVSKSAIGKNELTDTGYAPYMISDFAEDDILFHSDTSLRIKAGTKKALVEYLTSHVYPVDIEFVSKFLLSFRLFIKPSDFVEMLVERFNIPPPDDPTELKNWKTAKQRPVQKHVMDIMQRWLREFWYDREDSAAIEDLRIAITKVIRRDYQEEADRLMEVCVEREFLHTKSPNLSRISLNPSPSMVSPTSQVSSNKSSIAISPRLFKKNKNFRVQDFDPAEVARQLTLLEASTFLDLNPIDFLFYQPEKAKSQQRRKEGGQSAREEKNIRAMIQLSNQLTGWVAETILIEKDLKQRARILKHFIKIAEQCHQLQNYASREAIISALNSSPIYRLKKTWEGLSQKMRETFDALSKFMDRENNFITYRQQLKMAHPPCVPFIGLFLTDITFIKQGNADKVNQGRLINFDKYSRLANVLLDIRRLQTGAFQIHSIQELQDQLRQHLEESRDIRDLHDLSLTIEPRAKATSTGLTPSGPSTDKIASFIAEKGWL